MRELKWTTPPGHSGGFKWLDNKRMTHGHLYQWMCTQGQTAQMSMKGQHADRESQIEHEQRGFVATVLVGKLTWILFFLDPFAELCIFRNKR